MRKLFLYMLNRSVKMPNPVLYYVTCNTSLGGSYANSPMTFNGDQFVFGTMPELYTKKDAEAFIKQSYEYRKKRDVYFGDDEGYYKMHPVHIPYYNWIPIFERTHNRIIAKRGAIPAIDGIFKQVNKQQYIPTLKKKFYHLWNTPSK